jgi:hypothetical protein
MLQKKRNQKLEDGMVMDAQGVIYRQTGEGKSVVKVDLHSPMMQKTGWDVACYEIAEATTKIEQFAFNQCEGLKKVVIPSTVSVMSDYAFSDCSQLKEVVFKESATLRYLPEHAFHCCNQLEEIVIPNSVSFISDYAFSFCKNLRKVTIPDNIGFEKPADYSPSSEREALPLASLGLQFKLLEHALGSLECVMIPADKRGLLEVHWPHLKHLFVDKK